MGVRDQSAIATSTRVGWGVLRNLSGFLVLDNNTVNPCAIGDPSVDSFTRLCPHL
jgi:hypothetical protein